MNTTLIASESKDRKEFQNESAFARIAAVCALLSLAAFSFFYGIGSTLLFDWDEGAFSEATREMLAGGDFLTTYLNGEYRSAKPILIYWLQAGAALIFGVNEFAMRLPSAVCASLWAALVFFFLRRVSGVRSAFAGAVFMLGALQISIIGRAAISDALLNLWIAAAMFALYLHDAARDSDAVPSLWSGRNQEQRRFALLAFAAMGLGTLTKGPIAFLIPGAVSLLYFALRGRLRAWFQFWLNPAAIALFCVVTLPWFVLQYVAQGQAFIDGFFLKHNVGRFAGAAMEGHGGGPWFYLPVVLLGCLPFTAFLWKPLKEIRSDLREDLPTFAWLWFAFVFVFFSIASTKLPHYVIYGYTGLFVLMAQHYRAVPRVAAYIPPMIFSGLLFALPELLAFAATGTPDPYSLAVIQGALQEFGFGYRLLTGGAGLIFAALAFVPDGAFARARSGAAEIRLISAAFAMTSLLNFGVLPLANAAMQRPIYEAAQAAQTAKSADETPLVFWKFYWPSFLFYYGDTVPVRLPRVGELILMKAHELKYLKEYELLYNKNGVALARVTAMDREHYVRMMLE